MSLKDTYEIKIREALANTDDFLGETVRITVDNPAEMQEYILDTKNPFISIVDIDRDDVIIIYNTASYLAQIDAVRNLSEFCRNESYLSMHKCKIAEGTILDENQTVKWNREEVERRNQQIQELKKMDRHYHSLLERAVSSVIKNSANSWSMTKLTDKAIDILFAKAWEDGHSYGFMEVQSYFQEYLDMFLEAYEAMQ